MAGARALRFEGYAEQQAGDVYALERELVARAKADREAFGPLYARYADRVYWYAFHRLGNREAAEDATSRTFEKALVALDTCRDDRFRAWLFALARNTVTDALRDHRPAFSLDAAFTVADRRPSPAELVQEHEAHQRIRALLARLPEGQRQIVELRLSGLTGAEIARVLGRTQVAVRVSQLRAYQRLRRILESEPEALDGIT